MLSERLKELRKRDGLSQVEFAKKFNISTGTIGNWETGAREPDATTLLKIAKFFNVTVDYLLSDNRQKNPPQSDGAFDQIFSEKDELDISRRLDAMLSDLDKNNSALMFDGEPLDDESRELLISASPPEHLLQGRCFLYSFCFRMRHFVRNYGRFSALPVKMADSLFVRKNHNVLCICTQKIRSRKQRYNVMFLI